MPIAASTLYDFVQCPTRVALDAFGDASKRDPINPFVRLLWERGTLFERETIAKLDQPFTDLSEFKEAEKERLTLEAMGRGDALIYGGRISADDVIGVPDLLRKEVGGYIPGDIKSGAGEEGGGEDGDGRPKLHYAVQLALYVDVSAESQEGDLSLAPSCGKTLGICLSRGGNSMVNNKVRKGIGIVIPVFNDWTSLDLLIGKLNQQAELTEFNVHVFVIDDGSSEPLEPHCLSGRGRALVDIQLVRLYNNLGHQRAIAVGLVIASRVHDIEAVVVMDADGEDRPEDVPRLLSAWGEDPNLIVVAQRSRRSEGLVFKFFYALYKLAFRIMTGQRIDFGNFCLLPRASLCSLTHNPAIWNNLAAAITRSPIPRIALPVARGVRLAGKSRMNFQSLLVHGVSAMSVYADYVLLRILIGAALLAGWALIVIASIVGIRIGTNWAIPGWASVLASSFAIIFLQALLISGIALFQLMSFRNVKTFVPAVDASSFILEVHKNRIATRRSVARVQREWQ
jgi:glycosyltransferase involved in cell wall biosynthesis